MTHVRSATTSTPAGSSRAELERILNRYGCTRSGSDIDRSEETLTVWFTVADSKSDGAGPIPVRLKVDLREVRARLQRLPASRHISKANLLSPEHVERVAWRHVVLLVEAGLVAAEAGIKKVSEFFLADTLIRRQYGEGSERFIEQLEAHPQQWRAMLGSGAPE